MGQKIVSIVMLGFMLLMSTILMITFQFVSAQREQNYITERTSQTVLSTDGDIQSDSGVVLSGASLISSVKHSNSIDVQRMIVGRDALYNDYSLYLDGVILTTTNVDSEVNREKTYTLMYTLEDDKINIVEN